MLEQTEEAFNGLWTWRLFVTECRKAGITAVDRWLDNMAVIRQWLGTTTVGLSLSSVK